jgi:hypothetical protein
LSHPTEKGVVKIGSSKNPRKRLREFNILHPTRSYAFHDLRFFRKGYHEAEYVMHQLLSDHRLQGEWFDVDPDKASAILRRLHSLKEKHGHSRLP